MKTEKKGKAKTFLLIFAVLLISIVLVSAPNSFSISLGSKNVSFIAKRNGEVIEPLVKEEINNEMNSIRTNFDKSNQKRLFEKNLKNRLNKKSDDDQIIRRGSNFDEIINEDGSRTRRIFSSTRNVLEDGEWKNVKNARSLKDKGVLEIEYLEKDERYDFEIIDYNWTSIKFKPIIRSSEFRRDIPIKVNKKINRVINQNLKNRIRSKKLDFEKFEFKEGIAGKRLTIGNHSTTIILKYSGDAYCNELDEYVPSSVSQTSSPLIHDCDTTDESKCDNDGEFEAWIMFDAGFNLENVVVEDAELSLFIECDNDQYDDGSVDIFRTHTSYDPGSLTWDNSRSIGRSRILDGPKLDEGEQLQHIVTNVVNIKASFQENGSYFAVRGDADGDDIFWGELDCNSDNTYLTITYTPCDPSEPCCDETSNYKPAGTVCNALHDFSCDQADSSGCSGHAHEDRCDGLSGSCPDNNYEVFYPSACTEQVCVQESCSSNIYQPLGVCQDIDCVYPSEYSCSNNLVCDGNSCKDSCSSDSDCVSGYKCDSSTNICYKDGISFLNLEYDDNGNLIKDLNYNYDYNSFNNLVSVETLSNDKVEEYTYDENGQRLKKVIFNDDETNTTVYYVDENYIQIVNSSGSYIEKYYHLNGKIVGKVDANDEKYFYHTDHLGSTSLVTDVSGNVVADLSYEPFGLVDLNEERYLYEGKELDSTNLYYFNARYYDPNGPRFTQPDTIIQNIYDPQNLNRYSFERNNPYKYTDTTGNYVETAIDVVSIGISINDLYHDPGNVINWIALGADIGTTLLPVAAGGGMIVKGISKGDEAFDFGKALFKSKKGAYYGGKAVDYSSDLLKQASKRGFRNEKMLKSHFLKHGTEFGFKNIDEYQTAAKRFAKHDSGDVLQRIRPSGDIVKYNKKTNEYLAISKDGVIKTYFKPDPSIHKYKTNLEYFEATSK